jgi:hypothetical protein
MVNKIRPTKGFKALHIFHQTLYERVLKNTIKIQQSLKKPKTLIRRLNNNTEIPTQSTMSWTENPEQKRDRGPALLLRRENENWAGRSTPPSADKIHTKFNTG